MATEKRVFWSNEEWAALLMQAQPLMQSGSASLLEAVIAVQSQVLPRERMRKRAAVLGSLNSPHTKHLLHFLGTLGADANPLAALASYTPLPSKTRSDKGTRRSDPKPPKQARAPRPPEAPKPERTPRARHVMVKTDRPNSRLVDLEKRAERMPGRTLGIKQMRAGYLGGVHWSEQELYSVVASADVLAAKNRYRSEIEALIDAQDMVLPVNRRRAIDGIRKTYYDPKTKFQAQIAAAREQVRKRAEHATRILIGAPRASPAPTTRPIPQAVPPAPAAPSVSTPTPPPTRGEFPVPQVSPAALRFATSMAYAVDTLLADQTQAIGERLESMLTARMESLTETLATRVAGDIQASLARVVHSLMEHELGPVAPPAPGAGMNGHAEPRAQSFYMHDGTPRDDIGRPERIAVDVIGLLPGQAQIVAKEFEGVRELDLRFLETDKADSYAFRANVVSVTKFNSHPNERKAEKHGSNLIRVNGASQSVIAAVHQLMQAQGPSTAH